MPHQCVRCNTTYADNAEEILTGCSSCTGKLFFYVKTGKVEQAKATVAALSEEQKESLIENVVDVIGRDTDEGTPVVVDLESISVADDGVYSIDLKALLDDNRPVIYKLGEGQYVVDLAETFNRLQRAKNKK